MNTLSVAAYQQETFVNTVALVVLHGDFNIESEYQKGWWDGYAKAWTQITGLSDFVLAQKVNESIKGSGKQLPARS